MRTITFLLLAGGLLAASHNTDLYTAADMQSMTRNLAAKHLPFSSQSLEKYGNHYTMLAHREATGSSEVHEHEADVFFAVDGHVSIITGGKLVSPRTEKPGEIRGTSIVGGEQRPFGKGDVMHIAAGVPHQIVVEHGTSFTYFVVKVTGQ